MVFTCYICNKECCQEEHPIELHPSGRWAHRTCCSTERLVEHISHIYEKWDTCIQQLTAVDLMAQNSWYFDELNCSAEYHSHAADSVERLLNNTLGIKCANRNLQKVVDQYVTMYGSLSDVDTLSKL